MTISINGVPLDLRVPGVYAEVDNTRATVGRLSQRQKRAIIFGQKTSAGSATADDPVLVNGLNQADNYFGPGSVLAMACRAFKEANPYTELWAVPQDDDPAAVAATGSVSITGTATEAGAINLYIAGLAVRTAVAIGDDGATIAAAVVADIGNRDDLPVTAVVNGAVNTQIDFTAKNAGPVGNDIIFFVNFSENEVTPEGITVDISTGLGTIHNLANGTTTPNISTSISALQDDPWDYFISTYNNIGSGGPVMVIIAELIRRWGPLVQVPGVCFISAPKLLAGAQTWGESWNSPFLVALPVSNSPDVSWVWAASFAAQVAYYGSIDPARPFRTLEIPGVRPPKEGSSLGRWDQYERNTLLWSGCSTYTIDAAGKARIERAITTYRENTAGAPDTSYLDLNTILSLIEIRYQFWTRMSTLYTRHKLADDDFHASPGQAVVRPKDIKHEIIALFGQLEEAGIVENIDEFKNALVVERNSTDPNRVDCLIPPDLVNQFRILAAKIQFIL